MYVACMLSARVLVTSEVRCVPVEQAENTTNIKGKKNNNMAPPGLRAHLY